MKIEIVEATPEHAHSLAPKLRQQDTDEVMASGGYTPLDALLLGVEYSCLTTCWTALLDGEPEIMWGAAPYHNPTNPFHEAGVVWLLSSNEMYKIPGRFLQESEEYVAIMLERFDSLHNWVAATNVKSQQWLEALGFLACSRDEEHGVAKIPFILYAKVNPSCAIHSQLAVLLSAPALRSWQAYPLPLAWQVR